MKTRLLKRLRKNAKKNVFLGILPDGEFVVKSDIGWYTQGLNIYYFQKKFGNVVFSMTLHEAENILSDARRLYMKKQLMKFKVKKVSKNNKKTMKQYNYGNTSKFKYSAEQIAEWYKRQLTINFDNYEQQ